MFRIFTLLLIISSFTIASAQERKAAFGLQIEPVIPSALFRISTVETQVGDVLFTIEPRPGIAYGAMISANLTPRFTIETGINSLSRDYKVSVIDGDFTKSLQFKVVNFEMPLNLTYYVRLGPKLYMGHSAGFSFQFLPSNLKTAVDEKDASGNTIYKLEQISRRRYFMMPAFKGGIRLEFRTENDGYFFIGPTYRLFTVLYRSQLFYFRGQVDIQNHDVKPIGDYFGITLRYVFPPGDLLVRDKTKDKPSTRRIRFN
ncbi:MAG: hypothetical protein IH597_09010 [Bacteroidales bacterium]|nr:hypothetical protein [Bacteroidales bacterium]